MTIVQAFSKQMSASTNSRVRNGRRWDVTQTTKGTSDGSSFRVPADVPQRAGGSSSRNFKSPKKQSLNLNNSRGFLNRPNSSASWGSPSAVPHLQRREPETWETWKERNLSPLKEMPCDAKRGHSEKIPIVDLEKHMESPPPSFDLEEEIRKIDANTIDYERNMIDVNTVNYNRNLIDANTVNYERNLEQNNSDDELLMNFDVEAVLSNCKLAGKARHTTDFSVDGGQATDFQLGGGQTTSGNGLDLSVAEIEQIERDFARQEGLMDPGSRAPELVDHYIAPTMRK